MCVCGVWCVCVCGVWCVWVGDVGVRVCGVCVWCVCGVVWCGVVLCTGRRVVKGI